MSHRSRRVQAPVPSSSMASCMASTLRITEEAQWDARVVADLGDGDGSGVLADALDPMDS